MSKVSSVLFAAILFSLSLSMGCGGGDGGVIEQPEKTAAELEAEQKAYDAEMDADAEETGDTDK